MSLDSRGNMPIGDKTYRLLLSSGLTVGGLGLAWIFMQAIVPSKEEMMKVFQILCPLVVFVRRSAFMYQSLTIT